MSFRKELVTHLWQQMNTRQKVGFTMLALAKASFIISVAMMLGGAERAIAGGAICIHGGLVWATIVLCVDDHLRSRISR